MKFLPLILANLRRKKIRTVLTVGSFVVAFFLFGLLGAIHYGFRQGIDVAGADRLVVIGRTSIIQPLPLPYYERLKRLPGVKDVAYSTWFGGVYQDPKNFFAQFAINPDDWIRMYPEYKVDPQEWKAFLADRQGVIVGVKTMQRFGWKVGDHVPLKAPGFMGGTGWDFNIRGTYRGTRPNDDETQFWLRHDYLVEKGARTSGRASSAGTWSASRIPTRRAESGQGDRRDVRELGIRDADPERGVVCRGLRAADGQHRVPDPRDRIDRLLHAPAGDGQHDGHRRARADERAGHAEGHRVHARVRAGPRALRVDLIAAIGGTLGLWLANAVIKQDLTQGLILLYLPMTALSVGAVIALGTGVLAGLLPALNAMRLNVATALRRL